MHKRQRFSTNDYRGKRLRDWSYLIEMKNILTLLLLRHHMQLELQLSDEKSLLIINRQGQELVAVEQIEIKFRRHLIKGKGGEMTIDLSLFLEAEKQFVQFYPGQGLRIQFPARDISARIQLGLIIPV